MYDSRKSQKIFKPAGGGAYGINEKVKTKNEKLKVFYLLSESSGNFFCRLFLLF